MSGGTFDYKQHMLQDITEHIEHIIEVNGKPLSKEEKRARMGEDWYGKYPEDAFHVKYCPEVITKLKEGVEALKIAKIYAQRIDYLLAGDDGEENFLKRLKTELDAIIYI